MDWNEDGKKDIVTGESHGRVRIYLNTNTDENPMFDGFEHLMVDGAVYWGEYIYSMPVIVDWNNDGRKDVLVGDGSGRVTLILNEGTNSEPLFNDTAFLEHGITGEVLDYDSHSSPDVADFNRDGKKDLLVGGYDGNLMYYENLGTDADPYFEDGALLEVGGQTLKVGNYIRACFCDWNDDGVLDLLCGARRSSPPTAGITFYEAIGPLDFSADEVSANSGGSIQITLDAGPANSGRAYYLVGTFSGTEPGTPLPGGMAVLPIHWDIFTDIMLGLINTPVFTDFTGTMDVQGQAFATLNAPPLPTALGHVMTYAYALKGPWDFASNHCHVEFVP